MPLDRLEQSAPDVQSRVLRVASAGCDVGMQNHARLQDPARTSLLQQFPFSLSQQCGGLVRRCAHISWILKSLSNLSEGTVLTADLCLPLSTLVVSCASTTTAWIWRLLTASAVGRMQSMFEESPLPSLAGHTGGSPAEQDSAPRGFSMESMLADIAEIPGIDPRGCLQGALLPRGISKLRVMDILNLFLEGVVEQIENPLPDERSEATTVTTAASTCATPCTGLSLASSSARSTMSRASHRLQMGPDVGKATKTLGESTGDAECLEALLRTSSYTPHGTQPSAPSLAKNARRGTAPPSSSEELRRLRAALQRQQALATAQAAQSQEFKDMSEQSNSELVAVEGEARDLRDEVARLSRQNKQLLLQLRQQRLKHQQELKLWQSRVGETGDVEEGAATASLLSYLQGASEQQDSQLRRDLSAQTAETVLWKIVFLGVVCSQSGSKI
eukprot:s7091_g2.t1